MSVVPFSPHTILRLMAECLPPNEQPQLRNPHDAIALFTHACMLSVGFKLVGLSEDDRLGSCPTRRRPQGRMLTPGYASFAVRPVGPAAVAVELELERWR